MPFANLPQRWIGQYEAEVPIVGNWRKLLGQSENPVLAALRLIIVTTKQITDTL